MPNENASPATIINVDDHEAARYAKNRILSRAGFKVFDAGTGREALALSAAHGPDLVLLDFNLPDLHGVEVCRRLKSQPGSASAIVLQISASATTAPHAIAALDSGADAYLAEPVDPDVLISTIRALLRLRAVERELSAANERLLSVNQELKRSNEDLELFAFAASHDLQEPLRTITSFATLLDRTAAPKLTGKEQECLKRIVDGSLRMRALIDDLLTYSQVGRKPDSFYMVELNSVLGWALENLRDRITQSECRVTSAQLPTVIGDEAQLAQVLQNLIGNSIKYARSGVKPLVHVSAAREGQEWVIAIADNGIGIDVHHQKLIFSAFKRLHGKEIPGTGLGLAVCRKVVEAHGGRLWVESTVGEGSTFLFTLPVIAGS